MTYQIIVPKIHCSGCVNLIKISLEEVFSNVEVDQETKIAEFQTDKDLDTTKQILEQTFEELRQSGYEYSDLKLKN